MNIFFTVITFFVYSSYARIHRLEIRNDSRQYIALSTFGFYKGGILNVSLEQFHVDNLHDDDVFGFSLDKTKSDALMNFYLDSHLDRCILEESVNKHNSNGASIYLIMDFKKHLLKVNCSSKLDKVNIFNGTKIQEYKNRPQSSKPSSTEVENHQNNDAKDVCSNIYLPMTVNKGVISSQFLLYVSSESEEGLYHLYFHSCPNYNTAKGANVNFVVNIRETNKDNYLSAGEMPLPALYFTMAFIFLVSGSFWVYILLHSKHPVFKIHYLMAVLVYLKCLSLLFHGINFHFIQTRGEHVATWAILYYITHLLKGSVLFIVIVLVGTGWTFIKHILSEKDKKIFMIVIPLQVLANVAEIIIEESEEGDAEHGTWLDIFILVDLLCCGAILLPVVWSIRNLQEASQTSGKAAINLRKLKLFRHFYIMIVCYFYFTRFIVSLLKIIVPFQYEWHDEMFKELATYIFFILTGYKFRPASANPYFQVASDEDDDETDIVITKTGLTEGLKKVNRIESGEREGTEEEKGSLISQGESSHELD